MGGRQGPAVALDKVRDQWVVFGGYQATYRQDTWIGDGGSWLQATPATSPSARSSNPGLAYMTWDPGNAQTVLFGGGQASNQKYLGDTWAWNGTNWVKLAG